MRSSAARPQVGLCAKPPVGLPHALLALSNNTCIRDTFQSMRDRFGKLRQRNFYLHHYTEFMEVRLRPKARGSLVSSFVVVGFERLFRLCVCAGFGA